MKVTRENPVTETKTKTFPRLMIGTSMDGIYYVAEGYNGYQVTLLEPSDKMVTKMGRSWAVLNLDAFKDLPTGLKVILEND